MAKIIEHPFCCDEVKTIEDFWNLFIEKPMIEKGFIDSAKKCHKILMDYIELPNTTFSIRHCSKPNYSKCKGWITNTTENYSFVYCDNETAKFYFQKCLEDNFPTAVELKNLYDERKIPFSMSSPYKPGTELLIRGGYKLSHIFDVGINYCPQSDKESFPYRAGIVKKYFALNSSDNWQKDDKGFYVRKMYDVSPDAKDYLIALFFRYVHPFNYFLSPAIKFQSEESRLEYTGNDIGEHEPIKNFVQGKFADYFGKDYEEFLNLIMPPQKKVVEPISEKEIIDLKFTAYEEKPKSKTKKTKVDKTIHRKDEPKALRKIKKWSKVDSNISKVIRAFFMAVDEKGVASYSAMEKFCIEKFKMSAESFKNKRSQLMCEKDTSDDGKVFDKNGDDVTVWKPIKEKLYKNFQ